VRVAALYDVHGNLPALEAVLAEVEHAGVDLLLFGGDLVSGPLPRETLERLTSLDARFVRGNADRALAAGELRGGLNDEWIYGQLSPEQLEFLGGLPQTITVDLDGLGPALFCHATPRRDDEIFTAATPEERLRRVFADVSEPLVVCGHTHMQFDRRVAGVRVVNAGSVGMPYGETGAEWALLGPDVEFRRTDYDLEAAAARLRAGGWPQAEEFVAENVLSVPSRERVTAFFEGQALQE
jgi:putative phosphoesterase